MRGLISEQSVEDVHLNFDKKNNSFFTLKTDKNENIPQIYSLNPALTFIRNGNRIMQT